MTCKSGARHRGTSDLIGLDLILFLKDHSFGLHVSCIGGRHFFFYKPLLVLHGDALYLHNWVLLVKGVCLRFLVFFAVQALEDEDVSGACQEEVINCGFGTYIGDVAAEMLRPVENRITAAAAWEALNMKVVAGAFAQAVPRSAEPNL